MGDDLERRVEALVNRVTAVEKSSNTAEILLPRFEAMLKEHMTETKVARQATNEKLDALIAKENQNKGVSWFLDKVQSVIIFLVGIGAFKWLGLIR